MRSIVLIVVALVIAGAVAFSVKNIVGGKGGSAADASANAPRILVAKSDIPAGSFIRPQEHLEWSAWPKDNLHPSYIVPEVSQLTDFSGAVARSDIRAGEPLSASRMVKPGEGGFMSAVLTPGLRAVSIAVTATSGNAGFIFPGDRVDMILTHEIPNADGTKGHASETFIENVRVLAMDQRYNTAGAQPNTAASPARTTTLEVTKEQAEAIQVAIELGKISLSLRSLAVDQVKNIPQVEGPYQPGVVVAGRPTFTRDSDVSRLLGQKDGPQAMPRTISVTRGDESQEIKLDGVR